MKLTDLSVQRNEVLALYDKTHSDIQCDINILKEWMKKQPHLPVELIQDEFLEIYLLKNKFSFEKTKSKIDNYCSLKKASRYTYLYAHKPQPSKESMFYLPLPVLTENYHRILLARGRFEEDYQMLNDFGSSLFLREFLSRYDYNNGEIFIFDFCSYSTSTLSKFRINVFVDALTLILKAYAARIQQIHIINKAAKALLTIVKPLISTKLSSRIHLHDDYESLTKILPAKYLPKEYGGELKSVEEMYADWDDIFQTNDALLDQFYNTMSREELGRDKLETTEMQGTFKKLNID